MGIVNGEDYQIVFSDTPGVLKPKFKLQESMLDFSRGALIDADVLLYVTDVVETPTKNQDFLDKVAKEKIPVLLVINKIDLLTGGQQELEALVEQWKQLLPQAEVFPTSALHNFNVSNIMHKTTHNLQGRLPGQICVCGRLVFVAPILALLNIGGICTIVCLWWNRFLRGSIIILRAITTCDN